MPILYKRGSYWAATYCGYRISVRQTDGQWTAEIHGRHFENDRATLTGPTIHNVAAQARAWIEQAVASRRD